MSKRLQIVMDDAEYREIQRTARRHRLTVSGWVRQVLRTVRGQEPGRDADRKLGAVRAAVRHEFPAGDVEQMLAEIERGYVGDAAR